MADTAKFREDWEHALYGPALDLRLYAFRRTDRRVPHDYDSGFLAVMGSIGHK